MKPAVLVTGSSRGIGRATAKKFALAGYPTAIHYHTHAEEAQALHHELMLAGCRVMTVQGDVSREDDVMAMFSEVAAKFGPVGILVNNAGIALPQGVIQDCTADAFDRLMAVNVRGAFLCCREAVSGMLSLGGGSIVNVSSMWGLTGGSCEVAYSTSKAAVIGLTKSLAKELAPSRIRVNAVAPGFIDTEMNAHLSKEDREAFRLDTPLEAIGAPGDVADAILFLAGDRARFITGQVLPCDGGMVI